MLRKGLRGRGSVGGWVFVVLMLAGLVWAPCSFGLSAWWGVSSGSRPAALERGGVGEIVLTVENLGDSGARGDRFPVRVMDSLPAGLKAVSVVGGAPFGNKSKPISCEPVGVGPLTCVYEGVLPAFDALEVRIAVKVSAGAEPGELNSVTVSGGEAPSVTLARPVLVSEAPAGFGVEDFSFVPEEEGGGVATQAGSHPFQLTTSVTVNQGADSTPVAEKPEVEPEVLPKDFNTDLPAGLVGNPTSLQVCTLGEFLKDVHGEENECPPQSAIGVASATVNVPGSLGVSTFTVPVFNLEPYFGEPARLGFFIAPADVPIVLDPSLRSGLGEDDGINVLASNISETAGILSARVTIWGVPGDPRHDSSRGWGCIAAENQIVIKPPCNASEEAHPHAFLSLPASCEGPLQSSLQGDSWSDPGVFQDFPVSGAESAMDGCNEVPFAPAVQAAPTTGGVSSPTGLDFNVDVRDEGLTGAEGVSQSEIQKTVVALPEGVTLNPSAGVGLSACSPAQYASETLTGTPGTGCPTDSQIGEVTVETPLLSKVIHGGVFVAEPYVNPFGSLLAVYVIVKDPETGVLVRLAGEVIPNTLTGQLTAVFKNIPQLPFDHFNLRFREGPQAPLVTPPACGTYTTVAQLTPWASPTSALTDTSSFTITTGTGGGPCPAGAGPFTPTATAGSLSNTASAFSSFYLHLTRSDSDQDISSFATGLPGGLSADLTGVPFCPEAAIAAARVKTGIEEQSSPSCPAASEIGHSLVGSGVGSVLAYVPGKIYLAGPFEGAPFSLVSVTPALVGPFDLGTVVLMFALRIDPYTTNVSVIPSPSEPVPRILKGIVTHVRDIRAYIDRPNFTLNPTSCDPTQITSTITSTQGATTSLPSRFQAADCANLKFSPKLITSTSAHISRVNGASLNVKLAYPKTPLGTQTNIAKVKVSLPRQLPSRLTTLHKACLAAVFEANPASCPPASVVGHAKAITPILPVPVQGPVYLVSHGNEAFPAVTMLLQGYGVTIDLVGTTLIKKGITSNTFKAVPDQPVTSFEVTFPQGPYSLFGATTNLCNQKLTMPTNFTAHNGTQTHQNTKITVTNCPKPKHTTHKTHTKKHK